MSAIPVSVIVPVYNDAGNLAACLRAIRFAAPAHAEVIVVDDGSSDESAAVAVAAGTRVIRSAHNAGPAAARNRGSAAAQSEILFFVDADVLLAPDTVRRVLATFEQHPEVAAVFGSYDAVPRAEGVVSQYRNLLHHFIHQHGHREADTFWAGCGAIRRDVFLEHGGFNEEPLFARSMEDVELGYRLRHAGHRIVLDKCALGTHLKRWTLASMVRTDVFYRAVPWSHLILRSHKAPNALNLQRAQRVCGALVLLAVASLALTPIRMVFALSAAVALAVVISLNRQLYRFFLDCRGARFAVSAVLLHLLYFGYSSVTFLAVWCTVQLRRVRVSGT